MNLTPADTPRRRRYTESNFFELDLFLMVDERLIENSEGATWEFCPLQKANSPVLLPSEPWEGGDGTKPQPVHQDILDGSVLWDAEDEQFIAWYRTHNRIRPSIGYVARQAGRNIENKGQEGSNYCLAKSKDGLHWEKPEVGAILYQGSYRNNMVPDVPGPILQAHASGVVPNYLNDGKPELVATVYSTYADPLYPYGITHMHSGDGIDWVPHYPPPLPLDGDAHFLMWDPRLQCYLCTTRSAQHSRMITRLQEQGRHEFRNKRHVALAKSRDLIHWTPMLDILEVDSNDPENSQIYSMYILPYGNMYLGFIEMFYMSANMTFGPLDMQLAISYNLEHWHRAGRRQPVLARGGQGSWDSSHVRIFANPPHPSGNQLRFFYGGKDAEHWQAGNAGIGAATLRRDGFACWTAGPEGGTITTIPLRMEWATWPQLNVEAEDGEVRLEILTEDWQPIEGCSAADCRPISGNHLRAIVQFGERRGSFVRHSGRVRFRFHLRNAKLYAFRSPNTFIAESADGIKLNSGNLWL